MKEKLPPADLDLFHGFWWRAENDKTGQSWGRYLKAIKSAKAFSLSDDMVEVIAEMAFRGDPKDPATARRLDGYRQLAKPPYEFSFIEFDYAPLAKWFDKNGFHTDQRPMFGAPERLGWLLDARTIRTRDDTRIAKEYFSDRQVKVRNDVYRITALGKQSDPVEGTMLGAALHPIVQTVTTGPKFSLMPNPETANPAYIEAVVRGNEHGVSNAVCWGLLNTDNENLGALEDIHNNPLFGTGAIEPEPLWLSQFSRTIPGSDWSTIMSNGCIEQRFDLRFIVAALALLNHTPVIYTPYRRKGFLRPRMEARPFMTTNLVTLEIPASRRRVKDINDHLKGMSGGWHNRRHEVRGHWRVSDKQVTDKWEHFYDPMTEKWRWRLWIENHQRGDASLGWANKNYKVEASRRASQ